MTDEELRGLFDGLRQDLRQEVAELGAVLRQEMGDLGKTLRGEMGAVGQTLRQDTAELGQTLRQETAGLAQTLRQEIAETRQLVNDKFDNFQYHNDHRFDLLAEGLLNLNEKIDWEAGDIRREMREGFAETHALIRFSHGDLDRRVTHLERGSS